MCCSLTSTEFFKTANQTAQILVILLTTGLGFSATTDSALAARTIEEITFESGSVGANGSPAASGWQFHLANLNTSVTSANQNRSFTHGTNDEALILNPFLPGQITAFREQQGAFWDLDQDSSEDPNDVETFDAGEVFFAIMEGWSDVSSGTQTWKTQATFGIKGDGGGGFEAPGFDTTPGSNQHMTLNYGNNSERRENVNNFIFDSNGLSECSVVLGPSPCRNLGGEFTGTRYGSKPLYDLDSVPNVPGYGTTILTPGVGAAPADLDKTHVTIHLLRHGVDAANSFVGTELELSDTLGHFNGGDSDNHNQLQEWNDEWGGNRTVVTGKVIDRAAVFISRAGQTFETSNVTSSWIDNNQTDPNQPDHYENVEIGIKYLRFGTAEITDVNLDGVTDAADEAIVLENLDKYGPTAPAGDFDNDGDVDGFDFLVWQADPNVGLLADWEADFGSLYLGRGTFFVGDVDNDLDVDADDLALVQAAIPPLTVASSTVPEPSAAALMLLGVFLCSSWTVRRSCHCKSDHITD